MLQQPTDASCGPNAGIAARSATRRSRAPASAGATAAATWASASASRSRARSPICAVTDRSMFPASVASSRPRRGAFGAGVGRAHRAPRRRRASASSTWRLSTGSERSRSAHVRATLRTRFQPRPLRPSRSCPATRAARPPASSPTSSGDLALAHRRVRPPLPEALPLRSRASKTRAATVAESSPPSPASAADGRLLDGEGDVEAIGQCPAEPGLVAADPLRAARAASRCRSVPARTGIGGGEDLEPGREGQRSLRSRDRHRAVLDRLPQRLEARARELTELVEEEHAVMGEGDLPRSRRRTAADQPGRRDRVMRGPERPRGQRSVGGGTPGDAGDLGDLDRLRQLQRRQDRGQAPGRQRLPAPGGPMTSAPCPPAAATSSPRRSPRWPFRSARSGRRASGIGPAFGGPSGGSSPLTSSDRSDNVRTAATAIPSTSGPPRHSPRRRRFPAALPLNTLGHREHSRSGRIEPSSASSRRSTTPKRLGGDLTGGAEDRRRDRQVESRARLAQIGRREVRGDPLQRELEARVDDCRPDALARLPHRGVRQSDERERRQAAMDVDLDVDGEGVDAVERECSRPGEHATKLGAADARVAPSMRRLRTEVRRFSPLSRGARIGTDRSPNRHEEGATGASTGATMER